jgi:hypothetical protein
MHIKNTFLTGSKVFLNCALFNGVITHLDGFFYYLPISIRDIKNIIKKNGVRGKKRLLLPTGT